MPKGYQQVVKLFLQQYLFIFIFFITHFFMNFIPVMAIKMSSHVRCVCSIIRFFKAELANHFRFINFPITLLKSVIIPYNTTFLVPFSIEVRNLRIGVRHLVAMNA